MLKLNRPNLNTKAWWESYHSHNTFTGSGPQRLSLLLPHLLPHTKLLEIGAAGCTDLLSIQKYTPSIVLYGIDHAIYPLLAAPPNLHRTQADALTLPFKPNSFHTVWCSQTLEHLDNPPQATKEMLRVTTNQIFLSLPYQNAIDHPSHLWLFNETSLPLLFPNTTIQYQLIIEGKVLFAKISLNLS